MATSPKQNEILQLQSEITNEIHRDASSIAQGVFGENKNHPDMAQVSNQQLDDLYRLKYFFNDRQWLQAEARRDPQQFLDVAKRIGVQNPNAAPGAPPSPDPNAFAKAAMATVSGAQPTAAQLAPPPPALAAPAPPALPAAAAPVLPPPPVPPAPPPVILGPNGQPLPPGRGLPS